MKALERKREMSFKAAGCQCGNKPRASHRQLTRVFYEVEQFQIVKSTGCCAAYVTGSSVGKNVDCAEIIDNINQSACMHIIQFYYLHQSTKIHPHTTVNKLIMITSVRQVITRTLRRQFTINMFSRNIYNLEISKNSSTYNSKQTDYDYFRPVCNHEIPAAPIYNTHVF